MVGDSISKFVSSSQLIPVSCSRGHEYLDIPGSIGSGCVVCTRSSREQNSREKFLSAWERYYKEMGR